MAIKEATPQEVYADVVKTYEKLGDLIEALGAAINREPTIGQEAKRCLDFFVAHWKRKYPGEEYVVNGAKDMNSLKRILRTLTPDQVAVRVRNYFAMTDPFIVNARHSLPVFVASINKISDLGSKPATYVVGCLHTPRCSDEARHTRRTLDEQRAGR